MTPFILWLLQQLDKLKFEWAKNKKGSPKRAFLLGKITCRRGSDATAAGGGEREQSEWQRSARRKSARSDEAAAGHRNRDNPTMPQALFTFMEPEIT